MEAKRREEEEKKEEMGGGSLKKGGEGKEDTGEGEGREAGGREGRGVEEEASVYTPCQAPSAKWCPSGRLT